MYIRSSLEIRDSRGGWFPNTLFRQEGNAEELGLLFPGLGYTAGMPVLYYSTLWILWSGTEVLWVEYDYTALEAQRINIEEQAPEKAAEAMRTHLGNSLESTMEIFDGEETGVA